MSGRGRAAEGADGKKGKVIFSAPSFLGGKNQQQMAYSPQTGLFYVPANECGMEIWNEPITYKKGAAYLGAGFTIKTLNDGPIGAMPLRLPCFSRISRLLGRQNRTNGSQCHTINTQTCVVAILTLGLATFKIPRRLLKLSVNQRKLTGLNG